MLTIGRAMHTKDVGKFERRLVHGDKTDRSFLRTDELCAFEFSYLLDGFCQQVHRAGCRAQGCSGDMGIAGCSPKAAMTEQQLYDPDVGSGFEKMGGEAMPERSDRDFFLQAGCPGSLDADFMNRFSCDRTVGITALEKASRQDERLSNRHAGDPIGSERA